MDRGCDVCTSYDVEPAKAGGGRVGYYCWGCETLYIDPDIVYGDVVMFDG